MIEGNIFLFPKSSDDHMWAIISDPAMDPENVVAVKFLTFHDYPDEQRACVIYGGEHQYFTHATYVDYAAAYKTTDSWLEALKKPAK